MLMASLPKIAFLYAKECRECGIYPHHTIQMHLSHLRAFLKFYQGDFLDVKTELIEEWIEFEFAQALNPEVQVASIEQRFRALKAFFTFLCKQQLMEVNPCEGLSFKNNRIPALRTLDHRDCQILLQSPKRLLRDRRISEFEACLDTVMLHLMHDHGLTLIELARLHIEDFDAPNLHVCGRNSQVRTLEVGRHYEPLQQYLKVRPVTPYQNLLLHMSGKPISRLHIAQRFEFHVMKSGLPDDTTSIQLRHSFAKNHIERGTDILELSKLLGHSSIQYTQRYAQFSFKQVQSAINSLPFNF